MPVVERVRADGSKAYLAQIDIVRKGERYRENRTFDKKQHAEQWIKTRSKDIRELIENGQGHELKTKGRKLSDAIQVYLDNHKREMGATKRQVLNTILNDFDIANRHCSDIGSREIVTLAQELSNGGRSPSTVHIYLSALSSVFAVAKLAWGFDLDRSATIDAMTVCNRLGITGRSKARDRRPTRDELEAILEYFETSYLNHPGSAPMHKITLFAMFSTRRESEIARAKHTDLDPETSRLFIKDMKHPGKKAGNDVWCDLPAPALQVAQSMKPFKSKVEKKRELIFGTSKDVISRRWTEACRMLGIEDLVFHDLRHEGISRLFEMGETIPQVAAVSGHRSWASMQRYTHLQTRGDRYRDWEWIERVTKT